MPSDQRSNSSGLVVAVLVLALLVGGIVAFLVLRDGDESPADIVRDSVSVDVPDVEIPDSIDITVNS